MQEVPTWPRALISFDPQRGFLIQSDVRDDQADEVLALAQKLAPNAFPGPAGDQALRFAEMVGARISDLRDDNQ